MTTSVLQHDNSFGKLILVLLALVILLAAGIGISQAVQLGIHAPIRHQEASEVSAMFDGSGRCDRGPSAELYLESPKRWMYICFDGDEVNVWLLVDRITSQVTREITGIPAAEISKPVKYITSVVRRGYVLKNTFGELPGWFLALFP